MQQLTARGDDFLTAGQALADDDFAGQVTTYLDGLELCLAVSIHQPHSRLAEVLGQCRPRQLDHGRAWDLARGTDYRAQPHAFRQFCKGNLDLYRAALRRHGRGNFTHDTGGLDARVIEQTDHHGLVFGLLKQQ
ncbi:hypothetical protein D3C80_1609630 [compost metagenome]